MTRPLAEVKAVLVHAADGMNKSAISKKTGVSRTTVRNWLADPEHALRRAASVSGMMCHGRCEPWSSLDERAYAYLLGAYLGDGHIVHMARTYKLVISCDLRYPRIIEEIADAIGRVVPNRVGRAEREGCTNIMAHTQHWPCFFPQHGPGRKHERRIVLEPWQQDIVDRYPRPLLRGLIHSDGWRGHNVAIRTTELATEYRYYTRYQFSNRSEDIHDIFCHACNVLGVHWTRSNRWTISVARRKDVHHLDSFIGPKR